MDALNDQLTEERKRCRDLQWAMEKEKCRTVRTEESSREELEVRMEELLGLLCWNPFKRFLLSVTLIISTLFLLLF